MIEHKSVFKHVEHVSKKAPFPQKRLKKNDNISSEIYDHAYISNEYILKKDPNFLNITDKTLEAHRQWLSVLTLQQEKNTKNTKNKNVKKRKLYSETQEYFSVPRFYGLERWGLPNPNNEAFVEEQPKMNDGSITKVKFEGVLFNSQPSNQIEIVKEILKQWQCEDKVPGGIISIPCGYGKTIISLAAWSWAKIPYDHIPPTNMDYYETYKALFVVHTEALLEQTIKSIKTFLPTVRVGRIQGKIRNSIEDNDIIVGMIQTLSIQTFEYDYLKHFGIVIYDETHRVPAEFFAKTVKKIFAKRSLGLSATPRRNDGLSYVLHWLIGPIIKEIKREKQLHYTAMIVYNLGKQEIVVNKYLNMTNKHEQLKQLVVDQVRNKLIIHLLMDAILCTTDEFKLYKLKYNDINGDDNKEQEKKHYLNLEKYNSLKNALDAANNNNEKKTNYYNKNESKQKLLLVVKNDNNNNNNRAAEQQNQMFFQTCKNTLHSLHLERIHDSKKNKRIPMIFSESVQHCIELMFLTTQEIINIYCFKKTVELKTLRLGPHHIAIIDLQKFDEEYLQYIVSCCCSKLTTNTQFFTQWFENNPYMIKNSQKNENVEETIDSATNIMFQASQDWTDYELNFIKNRYDKKLQKQYEELTEKIINSKGIINTLGLFVAKRNSKKYSNTKIKDVQNALNCDYVFASYGLAKDAIDRKEICTIVDASIIKDCEQSDGRGLRFAPNKQIPLKIEIVEPWSYYKSIAINHNKFYIQEERVINYYTCNKI